MSLFPGYSLKHLTIQPGLVLAPMSGVTSTAFRRLIRELNPGTLGLVITEFISVEAMTRQIPRSLESMRFHESERPVGIQIFGYDIDRMRDAALMVQDAGADLVDINCGCPAPKVVRKGGGCELMRQPEHLAKILKAVRAAVSIPLTIKFRSGWNEETKNAMQIAHIAESEGVEAITIHGRTRAQLYRGEADWEVVRQVAASVKVPVLGSGDVVCRSSALKRLYPQSMEERSLIAGLFIGRAAIANPFIFTELVTGVKRSIRQDPALALGILDRYAELLAQETSPKAAVGRMKQLVSQMCRGLPWRISFLRAANFQEQCEMLRNLKTEIFTPKPPEGAETLQVRMQVSSESPIFDTTCS